MSTPSLALTDTDDTSCWICSAEGSADDGKGPLKRECGCKGESGFAHLSCIVEQAKEKSRQWDGGKSLKEFREPWRNCPKCQFPYLGQLAIDLQIEFVSFAGEEYADDKRCELEALEGKLTALQRVGVDKLQPSQKVEPVDTATKIISIVGEMKAAGAPPSAKEKKAWQKAMKRNLKIQANAYQQLGHITLEGAQTKDDALKAMKYFGEHRDISKLIENSTGVMTAEKNIALAGSKMANLGKSKSKVNIFKTKDEKASMSAIRDGVSLAMDLKKIHRSIQAERMLTTLTATGKRVLGEEHSLTKRAEKDLKQYQVRYVQFKSQYEGKQFQALRYEEDGKKCVVQGPVSKPRKIKDEETMTVATADIKPVLGTPVVCHGLKDLSFLNGKIGDLQARGEESDDSYKVHFEDKKILPAEVKLGNLRIVFELPEE